MGSSSRAHSPDYGSHFLVLHETYNRHCQWYRDCIDKSKTPVCLLYILSKLGSQICPLIFASKSQTQEIPRITLNLFSVVPTRACHLQELFLNSKNGSHSARLLPAPGAVHHLHIKVSNNLAAHLVPCLTVLIVAGFQSTAAACLGNIYVLCAEIIGVLLMQCHYFGDGRTPGPWK